MNRIKKIRNLQTVIYRASKDLRRSFSYEVLKLFNDSEKELQIQQAYLALETVSDL